MIFHLKIVEIVWKQLKELHDRKPNRPHSWDSLQHWEQEAPSTHPAHLTYDIQTSTMSQPRPPPPGTILPGGGPPALIPPQLIAPFQAAWERHAHHQAHDSAHRHPVFFTERLMRPPPAAFGIGQAPSLAMSPVAQGYVYQEGQAKVATHASKL